MTWNWKKILAFLTYVYFNLSFTDQAQTQLSLGNRGVPFPQQQMLGGGQMV